MKAHYRTFNIKGEDLTPGDDFGMMREVLRRRFTRLAKEDEGANQDPEAFPQRPDLILIDGGKGQFEATRTVLADLGVNDVTIVAIAKGLDREAGRETFFVEGKEPFRLPPRDPALYFVRAIARRGASLRYRHTSCPPQERLHAQSAGRNCRRRPGAQALAVASLRYGQGGFTRGSL